jgi:hypothetical protein
MRYDYSRKRTGQAMKIRQAALDDVSAISGLFRQRIPSWQRLNADGHVIDVPYEALTLYERSQHGGAWMSIETAAIWLNHLLSGNGVALVAVDDHETVIGYCEMFAAREDDPLGAHYELSHLFSDEERSCAALLDSAVEIAREWSIGLRRLVGGRVQFARITYPPTLEAEGLDMLSRCDPHIVTTLNRYNLPLPRQIQGFYRVNILNTQDYSTISDGGWTMPVGRLLGSHYQWEMGMTRLFDPLRSSIGEHALKVTRLSLSAGGQESFVLLQQLPDLRSADVSIWTKKLLMGQTISALRDWAHKEGYRALRMSVQKGQEKVLSSDAQSEGVSVPIHAIDVDL